eukprot:XP_001611843.1 variant erythrocyte surface antigen-1 family protein [Babesia bovis T2Bo]
MSATCKTGSDCGPGEKCLTQCPTNVKEAIDWVICMTGNDDGATACVEKVAKGVEALLSQLRKDGDTSIKDEWPDIGELSKDSNYDSGQIATYITGLINCLGERLSKFLGCTKCTQKPSGTCPQKGTCGLVIDKYTYCYSSASGCCINTKESDQIHCAKILLGCIPLIFSSLTYLYWNCCANGNGGKWKDCPSTDDSTGSLCTYLVTLGYDTNKLNKCSGSTIVSFLSCFKELQDCLDVKQSDKNPKSYAEFVNKIQDFFSSTEKKEGKNIPLQRLYTGASVYFQAFQQKHNEKVDKAKRPETICELLYWLLGLPYTPVGTQVESGSLEVLFDEDDDSEDDEDSEENEVCGYLPSEKCCKSPATSSECRLSPANADSFLLPPCYYSAFVLMSIQGKLHPGTNTTVHQASSSGGMVTQQRGPFLHDVYANKHFEFYYPSFIRSWIVTVWDVVYALYFQLGFLYKQCKVDYATGYGWKNCTYGKGVTCNKSQTWICTTSPPQGAQHGECGKDTNRCSPLQGYLCDTLTDFKCKNNDQESDSKSESKAYCAHLKHRPSSQWCPIPMGFAKNMKPITPERKGEHLALILTAYFEENTDGSSLYQLVLFAGIVSLRPPRCLGDMFAFFCGIGRLCNTKPVPKKELLDNLLKDTMSGYPGTPKPEEITGPLKTLAGSCTQPSPSKGTCHSLCSLSPPDGSACDSCTKYICSLSWSVYTVFAKESFGSYLSWAVYLIDDFQTNLNCFLKYFENVECKSGCSHCTNKHKCHELNQSSGCQCKVIECKGILGALYRFGFTYQDAATLKSVKTCSDFLQQLKTVTDGNPLKELIRAVNQMLYSIRLAFIFWAWLLWTAAIVYLIFGLVVDLDILHIRSHIWLKHTHNIPAFNLFAARRLKYGIQVYFGR